MNFRSILREFNSAGFSFRLCLNRFQDEFLFEILKGFLEFFFFRDVPDRFARKSFMKFTDYYCWVSEKCLEKGISRKMLDEIGKNSLNISIIDS